MNSCKKKVRRQVSIRCRKISSTSNRSLLSSSHVAPTGNYKRRITALLKNNKTLAIALQDARCELSTKRKILEESAEYLNKIKFARCKMLEMQSVLKSFLKDFDEALLLLKFDSNWLDFGAPTRLRTNFKSKMNQVVESVDVSEGVSIDKGLNFDQERVKSAECSSDQVISNSSDVFCKEIAEKVVDEVMYADLKITNQSQDVMETVSSTPTVDIIPVSDSHHSPISLCESPKDIIETRAEKGASPKNVSPLKNDEDFGTPKLSISLQAITDLEAPPKLKSNFSHEIRSLSTENLSKILINPPTDVASQKVQTSKIPRIQNSSDKIKGPNFSKTLSKEVTHKRKLVKKGTEESDSHFYQRKTFGVKENELLPNSESSATLNENLPNNDGESDTLCRRKTFVVKASGILEDMPNSKSDSRKTFVKKSSNQPTSVKNRRDTFTISEPACTVLQKNKDIDHCENLNISDVPVINNKPQEDVHLLTNDLDINIHACVKEKSTTVENPEEFHHILDNAEMSTNVNIPLETHSRETQEVDKILIDRKLNADNTTDKSSEELKTKLCCSVKDKQNKGEAVEKVKITNRDVTFNDDLPKVEENDIEILHISGSINGARPRRRVSYKLLFESSESECDSIPDDNLDFTKEVPSIKTTPIRRRISNTRKKVFVFDGNKRKSILSKKSVNKCINSKMSPNLSNVNNVANNIENQRVKTTKNVSFVSEQINKNDPVDNAYSDSCASKITACEVKSKQLSKKKYKCSDTVLKDYFAPITNELNGIGNKDLNYVTNASEIHHKTILSVITNKNFSPEVKQSKKTLNKKHHTMENIPCKSTEVICSMESESNKCHKGRNAKRNSPKDDVIIDDLIIAAKKSKRNNLKKKSDDNVSYEEEAVISNVDNGVNDLIEAKSQKEKAKYVKKNKSKVKTATLCKKTGKNTFLVHAEVHPPPSSVDPEIENPNKENTEMQNLSKEMLEQNFQVSVVLNDIFKSKNIDTLNISCEKDLILSGKTFPVKMPFSDSSSNIPQAPVESTLTVYKNVACVTNNSEEITTTRRRCKDVKSYKEPSLTQKLRR